MAINLIEKLLTEAVQTGGTYAEFIVSDDNVVYICDGGLRKSTRNYHRSRAEIKEVEKYLKSVSEKNLLFSQQLDRISITISDGRTAVFQKRCHDHFCYIQARKVTEAIEKNCEYVCFTSEKEPGTGIAFSIKKLKTGNKQIVPCIGEIMNGAITTGMYTDLQFVVSGSFHVKNGMLDSKFDQQNQEAANEMSFVMEDALKKMLRLGLLGMPLFSVLPNTMDEETLINISLIQAIRKVCDLYPLFRNRKGNVVSRNLVVYGTDEVTTLFPQDMIEPFMGDRYWIEPCKAGSREEYFLIDVGIPYYDRERFLKLLFAEENLDDCEKVLQKQSDKWLRAFYIFCSDTVTEEITKRLIISGLRNIRSIRDLKGKMQFPNELYFATKTKTIGKRAAIIKPDIITPSGVDDVYSEQLEFFFLKEIGIKEYSQKPEMEDLAAAMMNKKQPIDRVYAEKLVTLAKYDEEYPGDIDFHAYAIFPYESPRGIRRVRADKLVIGKPYIRQGGLLASATGRTPLWEGFKKLLNENDLLSILAFTERCGAIGLPKIHMQAAELHRDYSTRLYSPGKQGVRDSNYDYTITGLEEILKRRSLQLNKLVWSALLSADNMNDVRFAEYSVDNRKIVNRYDSSLIISLRERTWDPGKNGKLYKPEDIVPVDIAGDFTFDKKNPILKALQFGTGIKKREKAIKEMERIAAREGLRIISEDEYKSFLEWRNHKTC